MAQLWNLKVKYISNLIEQSPERLSLNTSVIVCYIKAEVCFYHSYDSVFLSIF